MIITVFVCTTNKKKLSHFQKIIPNAQPITHDLNGKQIKLNEIQSMKPDDIILHKLKQLEEYLLPKNCFFLVEDTSLFVDNLNGFPGPYIKDYFDKLGAEKVHQFSKESKCTIESYIGIYNTFSDPELDEIKFVSGKQDCYIVSKLDPDLDKYYYRDYDCIISDKPDGELFCHDELLFTYRQDAIKKFVNVVIPIIFKNKLN